MEMAETLSDCNYENTPTFSFDNQEFEALCVKVYDGDTITVVFKYSGQFHKFGIPLKARKAVR